MNRSKSKPTIRSTFLPFTRPSVGEEEIKEISDSIHSGWITTGPKVEKFANDLSQYLGAPFVIPVSSATAGLHVSLLAHGIGPGDEVITTPMTFAATANVIVLAGATPIFADIDRRTYQIRPEEVEKKITPRTKAILPVHFAGQPVDLDPLMDLAKRKKLILIEDAAHAIGTEYKGRRIGSFPHTAVFSFHPNKNITTGEGGAVATFDPDLAEKISLLRFHGMDKNAWKRFEKSGSARYDISVPGFKYNMMDIQAAMGIHQLKKLESFIVQRRARAEKYNEFFLNVKGVLVPHAVPMPHRHAWHLYTPLIDIEVLDLSRDEFMSELKERNIGSGLHYTAVHEFSYYARTYGYRPLDFPEAHFVSERIISLPLFPAMTDQDQEDVVEAVVDVCEAHIK
ncbi:MAG: UDP-4-amino-4-deoxy-L-arabinose--oxoglutarate aminotransferase [Elusimicrobia bacterium]|nr:UDP-4-amino-4-deoxy-L-arabinose--oxoglutarate aminotransferase [Elusimicrobiota bacterium]